MRNHESRSPPPRDKTQTIRGRRPPQGSGRHAKTIATSTPSTVLKQMDPKHIACSQTNGYYPLDSLSRPHLRNFHPNRRRFQLESHPVPILRPYAIDDENDVPDSAHLARTARSSHGIPLRQQSPTLHPGDCQTPVLMRDRGKTVSVIGPRFFQVCGEDSWDGVLMSGI